MIKGLILHDIYRMKSSLFGNSIIAIIMGLVLVNISNQDYGMGVIAAPIFLTIAFFSNLIYIESVTGRNYEEDRFFFTLPIKKKDVIKAKYIEFLLYTVAGCLFSVSAIVRELMINRTLELNAVLLGYMGGIGASLFIPLVSYPLALFLGYKKGLLAYLIAFMLSFVYLGVAVKIGYFIGFSLIIILYFISYKISVKIYKEKSII